MIARGAHQTGRSRVIPVVTYKQALATVAAIAGGLTVAACSQTGTTAMSASSAPSSSPAAKAAATPNSHATANAADTCDARPNASGDIFVRMITPGQAPVAQALGGEWRWDYTTSTCDTSVQMMIATAPTGPGSCTQVGYASSNPGYNPDATPAPPLKKVVASAGPAC